MTDPRTDMADEDFLIPDVAADLYRDRVALAIALSRLGQAGFLNLCIIAPLAGGRLQGGRFLGVPVFEGDVSRCVVAVDPGRG